MLPLHSIHLNALESNSGTASTSARGVGSWDQGSCNQLSSQLQSTASGRATRSSTTQIRQSVSEIYWCAEKSWSEPPETWLRSICNVRQITDDGLLCKRLMDEYQTVRGIKGRLFSWKTCLDVHFIRVRPPLCQHRIRLTSPRCISFQ